MKYSLIIVFSLYSGFASAGQWSPYAICTVLGVSMADKNKLMIEVASSMLIEKKLLGDSICRQELEKAYNDAATSLKSSSLERGRNPKNHIAMVLYEKFRATMLSRMVKALDLNNIYPSE